MPDLWKNVDVHTRVWTHLQRPDGRTLELQPGEEVELDLSGDFDDPYLRKSERSFKERFASKKVLKHPDPLD